MQILIDLDLATAARLEKVAPARSRRRSEFVRAAIRKALWDLEERATGRAYAAQPDFEPPTFDPAAWASRRAAPPSPAARPRRRNRK